MANSELPLAAAVITSPTPSTAEELYLDLMKKTLTRALVATGSDRHTIRPTRRLSRVIFKSLRWLLNHRHLEMVRVQASSPNDFLESGHAATNRVEDAETMIGTRQLDNMQACITSVLKDGVPGDLIEAGVWRGGMTIFMRAVLKAYGVADKKVWVADSFAGLPLIDRSLDHFEWRSGDMAVSLLEVKQNFSRYGLLDPQVCFLQGLFKDTLPTSNIERLSIMRIDADLYTSTMDALESLYSKLSSGGYAIFDDYVNLPDCRRAIDEYRQKHHIREEINFIDQRAVCWRKK